MRKLLAIVFVVAALAVAACADLNGQGTRKGVEQTKKVEDVSVNGATMNTKRTPVVVELFTSEGCSSCPPADALLARLDGKQPVEGAEVLALAMHVDYWNYLGWADPFSSSEFSQRQGEYATAYGKDGVYTPQMIVDGVKEFPGGNSGAAADAIGKAAREPKGEVRLARAGEQTEGTVRLSVSIEKLPRLTEGDAAFVLLAVTESGLSTDVARGENTGRKLTHVGVVRRLTTVGGLADARGGVFSAEALVPIEKGWRRENLRAVVFAQERGTRRVLAAGSLKL
jgi:hypothetical protein